MDLSRRVLQALEGRTACLKVNHGTFATRQDVASALAAATELEILAQHYLLSLQAGGPVLLSAQEIQEAITQFATSYRPNTDS